MTRNRGGRTPKATTAHVTATETAATPAPATLPAPNTETPTAPSAAEQGADSAAVAQAVTSDPPAVAHPDYTVPPADEAEAAANIAHLEDCAACAASLQALTWNAGDGQESTETPADVAEPADEPAASEPLTSDPAGGWVERYVVLPKPGIEVALPLEDGEEIDGHRYTEEDGDAVTYLTTNYGRKLRITSAGKWQVITGPPFPATE